MKKILIFLAIILLTPVVFAKSIKDIPFSRQSDTNLSKDFFREDDSESNLQSDTRFVEEGVLAIVDLMRKLMGVTAVIWAFYAGFQMVVSQGNEDAINKSKRQLRWSVIALLLVILAEPLLRTVFYGGGGDLLPGDALTSTDAAKKGVLEMEGLISYIQTFVALISIFMIITVGIKTIFSLDKEEAIENQIKTITWIGIGMILIFLNKVFIYAGILGNPVTGEERSLVILISELSGVLKYFLGFIGALSVGFMIYGGLLMITSRGEDEQSTTGKNIVINVILGIIIIVISYVLVSAIILSGGG